jgi:hypothetical protein
LAAPPRSGLPRQSARHEKAPSLAAHQKILQLGSPAFYLNAFFDRYTCVFLDPRRREIDSRTPAPQTAYPVITASQKQHKGGP